MESDGFIQVENKSLDDKWIEKQIVQKEVKEELEIWLKIIKDLSFFRKSENCDNNKHALFCGPPGTGKSYVAELLGQKESLAYNFFRFELEKYVGSSKEKIDKTFKGAKNILKREARKPQNQRNNKPVLIILDEIDSIGVKEFSSESAKNEPVNCLLQLIDDIKRKNLNIVVIGITNYPEKLDPALIRPGRLGNQIEFNYPNTEELTNLLQVLKMKATEEYSQEIKSDDKEKKGKVAWTEEFWEGVKTTIFENKDKGIFNSLVDMELALQKTVVNDYQDDSTSTPTVESFQKQLKKINKKKNIKGKNISKQQEVPQQEIPLEILELLKNLFELLYKKKENSPNASSSFSG